MIHSFNISLFRGKVPTFKLFDGYTNTLPCPSGMGTLDDMNHLKNKCIRSVADFLQDQFGVALFRLKSLQTSASRMCLTDGCICTQQMVTSYPLYSYRQTDGDTNGWMVILTVE